MWQRLRPWIFPVNCLGCDTPHVALCRSCIPSAAERCLESYAGVSVIAAGSYDGILRRAIVAMKNGERAYLDPFAEVLAGLLAYDVPLVPLPTSPGRRNVRGFDQAVELARRAATKYGCRFADVLVKSGTAQHGLNRRARLAADNRFRLKSGVTLPEMAILVDDVCTTGATLCAGISTLRAAGVAVMGAVVLARTVSGRNSRR